MSSADSIEVKFNFFQVVQEEGAAGNLLDILTDIQKLPANKREIEINGIPRLLTLERYTSLNYTAFLFTTKRMKGLPQKIKEDGSRESLSLSGHEGLGEDVAVALDPTGKLAAIQFNQYSMKETSLARYINTVHPGAFVTFLPIVKLDSLARLANARQLRRIHLKLAGFLNFDKLKECGLSTRDSSTLQELLSSPFLDIVWSAGRGKEGLSHRFLDLIPILKKYYDQQDASGLQALDILIQEGRDDDYKSVAIDMLADRLYDKANIFMNKNRELDKEGLLQAICASLIGNYHELKEYLPHSKKN